MYVYPTYPTYFACYSSNNNSDGFGSGWIWAIIIVVIIIFFLFPTGYRGNANFN